MYAPIIHWANDMTFCWQCHAGIKGGGGQPPLEFAKLNIADITGNEKKKIVIFHICVRPQLHVYFKQNPIKYQEFSNRIYTGSNCLISCHKVIVSL